MLSRVAENLYWIGRYVERAENVARLLEVAYHLELDAAELREESPDASPLADALSVLACRDAFQQRAGAVLEREQVLEFLTIEPVEGHSIRVMLGRARDNARASREALSADAWDQLNSLFLEMRTSRARLRLQQSPLRFLEWVKRGCALFGGLVDATLPRAEAYHFLQLGRHLERANQIGRILQFGLPRLPALEALDPGTLSAMHWSNLLKSCSAHEAYLQHAHDQIDPVGVIGFLILDEGFPRSIRFCIDRCVESVESIEDDGSPQASDARRLLGRLSSELRYLDQRDLLQRGLQPYLVGLLVTCHRIGDAVHLAYFQTT
ncbi:MAG: hypothetical protein KatS3mg108_1347 [Isosphaeraceae bacterium]|jgi:uncharacterized alpha-E superfamily protein|nr:MAG: hypothetical protein KatS3mg108_1347 [Isosphaeraceae bacterium]